MRAFLTKNLETDVMTVDEDKYNALIPDPRDFQSEFAVLTSQDLIWGHCPDRENNVNTHRSLQKEEK